MDYIWLLAGFIALTLSGNYLVKASVELAGYLKISTLVIGIVVVSFGTSAPELVVSVGAAFQEHPDISLGNVIGSNIANILLVLGFTAVIIAIPTKKSTLKVDWSVMMLASVLLWVFLIDGVLWRYEGGIFILIIFLYILWSIAKSRKQQKAENVVHKPKMKLAFALIMFIASSVGLVYGAKWLVAGASGIASSLGINDLVISATVIAFGTSVPELATSIIAAMKKQTDISIGNIIGSNIFNILGILGITASIKPIQAQSSNLDLNLYWMLFTAVVLVAAIIPFRKGIKTRLRDIFDFFSNIESSREGAIHRKEAIFFLILYVIYVLWVIQSGKVY